MCQVRMTANPFNMLIGALLLCQVCPVASADLFRYIDEEGVTVLDSQVPPRYVNNGYTVLSDDGRVLEVVPGALSPEEVRERDRKLAEQRRREKEKREREIADENLLRLYSTPEDVIRARDARLASIKGFIETSQANINRLEEQQRDIESGLADVERQGGKVDASQLERIDGIENRIRQIQHEINDKQTELTDLERSFAADLKRLRELESQTASNGVASDHRQNGATVAND